ncbi:MAG: glucuronate isomerase [Acholeplasmatales bacterium]|jgi:glucuronate isomerase|nr:glucuronate isomerase [Acholeplasmatales bacterium]
MGTEIIKEDFLLKSELAKTLYTKYASNLPIIDYHCHLTAKDIYENKKFDNLYDCMLSGDHYKWRLLRTNGVNEDFITGKAAPYDKFLKWAELVPNLIGSPLYHWNHLELKKYFGVNELLCLESAPRIYEIARKKLETFTAREIIKASNVEVICTTDDPTDDLKYHQLLRNETSGFKTLVIPAFRPDKAINIDATWFIDWITKLESVINRPIKTLESLEIALKERVDYFNENHCKLSDHGLDILPKYIGTSTEVDKILKKALNKKALTPVEIDKYKGYILVYLGSLYSNYNWTMQLHIGARRNLSSKNLKLHGPDTGFDAINDSSVSSSLALILDKLDSINKLPKTIVYPLNPSDFEIVITTIQCFQDGITKGKLQFGSSWWFLDNIDGMTKQIKALAANGLLARFVGMLTDSRSFLSYSRHDYFRRLLCNIIANIVDDGLFIDDINILGEIVEDISYRNALNYFNFS